MMQSLLHFWYPVLSSVDRISKRLQDPKMGFYEASCDLKGLVELLNLKSDGIITNAVFLGNKCCEKWGISLGRTRRIKVMPGELARDCGLTPKQEISRVMVEIMNRLKTEIQDRSVRLENLSDRFSFIIKLNEAKLQDEQELEKLVKDCKDFATFYENDITAIDLLDEIHDFFMLIKARGKSIPSDPKDALQLLLQFGRDVFPTLCVAYRMLLTIAFSIASCERSFSKLKLIKTYLRSTMSQDQLTNLALISIEKEFLAADVKKEVIQVFPERRSQLGHRF